MTILEMFSTIFIGMAIAAPVGPISLLCINTTLGSGFKSGFSAGLGAAVADGLVCLAALSGIELITSCALFKGPILSYFAAAFLVYVGCKLLLHSGEGPPREVNGNSNAIKSFFSTLMVTIINPLTLLSFVALFCRNTNPHTSIHTIASTASCIFLGSALWWLILASFLSFARRALGPRTMKTINMGSGLCILACGVKLLFV